MSRSFDDHNSVEDNNSIQVSLSTTALQGGDEGRLRSQYDSMSTNSASSATSNEKIVFEIVGLKLRLAQLKYISFLVTGVALLWPWNCYLSLSEYFTERFVVNSKLSNSYSSTMMTISTIASLIYNFILSQKQVNVNYAKRLKMGQILTIVIFFVIGLSCVIKTNVEPALYFTFIMLSVFLSALATCISQNGTMALVNVLGSIYANGVMVGQSIAGVLPSITLIISVLSSGLSTNSIPSDEKSYGVMIYFFTACLVSTLSVLLFKLVEYFDDHVDRYQELVQEPISMVDNTAKPRHQHDTTEAEDDSIPDLETQINPDKHVSFSYLWSRLKLIVITIFLTFSVTLVFPVFASTVQSTNFNDHQDSKFLNKKVFVPFIFLIWNVGDLAGRLSCAWDFFKVSDPKKLITYAILRFFIVPFFFLCNIKNRGATIDSDLFYIILQFVFGFSNGQLCSSCFMDVGHFVDGEQEQKAAGGFTTVFLSFGLAFGSVMSYLFVWLISS